MEDCSVRHYCCCCSGSAVSRALVGRPRHRPSVPSDPFLRAIPAPPPRGHLRRDPTIPWAFSTTTTRRRVPSVPVPPACDGRGCDNCCRRDATRDNPLRLDASVRMGVVMPCRGAAIDSGRVHCYCCCCYCRRRRLDEIQSHNDRPWVRYWRTVVAHAATPLVVPLCASGPVGVARFVPSWHCDLDRSKEA